MRYRPKKTYYEPMIIGIDEVGRGCWAGPVCVAAVALEGIIPGLADSKKLTSEQREILAAQIRRQATYIGLGWASHKIIDKFGLTVALRRAAKQALRAFPRDYQQILLDGNFNYIGFKRVTTIIKGDDKEPIISAASIIAKVARDRYMYAISRNYPQYGFERHVGYGTLFHRNAIKKLGPSKIHRMSWTPLRGESIVVD